jgi:hypothetical protein
MIEAHLFEMRLEAGELALAQGGQEAIAGASLRTMPRHLAETQPEGPGFNPLRKNVLLIRTAIAAPGGGVVTAVTDPMPPKAESDPTGGQAGT